jgi:putative heme iron utilization protein
MKRYAVADEVPEGSCEYITQGKEYPVGHVRPGLYSIVLDNGLHSHIFPDGCAHLDGKPWRIVEREE